MATHNHLLLAVPRNVVLKQDLEYYGFQVHDGKNFLCESAVSNFEEFCRHNPHRLPRVLMIAQSEIDEVGSHGDITWLKYDGIQSCEFLLIWLIEKIYSSSGKGDQTSLLYFNCEDTYTTSKVSGSEVSGSEASGSEASGSEVSGGCDKSANGSSKLANTVSEEREANALASKKAFLSTPVSLPPQVYHTERPGGLDMKRIFRNQTKTGETAAVLEELSPD